MLIKTETGWMITHTIRDIIKHAQLVDDIQVDKRDDLTIIGMTAIAENLKEIERKLCRLHRAIKHL